MLDAMAIRPFRPARARRLGTVLTAALVGAALAVGALAATKPTYGIGIVVAAAVVLLIAWNVRALPPILVMALFAEGVTVGGITVGRVIGVLALAVMVYYLLAGGTADLRPNALLLVALAVGFWILLSYYWAAPGGMVFTTFFQWALSVAFMFAFAILVRTEEHVHYVLFAFVVSAVLFGGAGFLTYLGSAGGARATGLTGDPNEFATYQALAVPAALVLAGLERRPQVRAMLYGAVGLAVVSIGTSLSRGGLITLAVIVAVTVLVPWHVFFRRPGQKVAYVLALVFSGWVMALLSSTQLLGRISTIFSPGQDKGSGRIDLWAAAWRAYTNHAGFGLGAGGFEANSLHYLQNTPGVNIAASYVAAGRPVHNSYLEMLVDLGPVGVILFLSLIAIAGFYLVRSALRFRAAGRYELQRIMLAFIAALLGLSVSMFFLSIELGKAVWIFAGLALAFDRMSARARMAPAPATAGRGRLDPNEDGPDGSPAARA
jgi:O-antigen ligase